MSLAAFTWSNIGCQPRARMSLFTARSTAATLSMRLIRSSTFSLTSATKFLNFSGSMTDQWLAVTDIPRRISHRSLFKISNLALKTSNRAVSRAG